jgi:subtilisin family serine protease
VVRYDILIKMVARPLATLLVTFVLAGGWLAPADASSRPARRLVGDTQGAVLVRFRPGVDRPEQAAIRRAAGLRLEDRLPLARLQLVEPGRDQTVGEAVAGLDALRQVAYAEPNFEYHIDAVPNDPSFGNQWGLTKIGAPAAWDVTTGSAGVVAAVLDTGLEYEHPDQDGNLWSNAAEIPANANDDDSNGFIDDTSGWDFIGDDADPRDANGHGSHVAGILGAQGNNGIGVVGVNWDVAIMPLRVCEASGSCDSASIVEAIAYAGDMGADVANMSFSGGAFSQAQKDALDAAPETLFVASAGNSGMNNDVTPQYPCSHTSANLICVAASTVPDGRLTSSNFGSISVDLAAPGDDVLSTLPAFAPLFTDDFEGTANWDFVEAPTTSSTQWERTTEQAAGGTKSITDSHGGAYAANENVAVTASSPWDLTNRNGCSVKYKLRLDTQPSTDWLLVEAGSGFQELDGWSGSTFGGFFTMTSDLGPLEDQATVPFRFRLTSNATDQREGAHIDGVEVRCAKPVASYTGSEGYAELSGTSMASPHVAGVGALLRAATPGATVAQLKAAILGTADSVPAFAGITVTGGRLNAAGATTFITDATPPGAFDLLSPTEGSIVSAASPTFSWQASAEPESGVTYQLFVDGVLNREVPVTSTGPAAALAEGPHSWFVRAVNGMGLVTESSTTRNLMVDLPAPPVHARAVSLQLRKHLVARGSVAVLDGFAACGQDVLVELQRKRDGVWKTVRQVKANDQGSFKSPLADRAGKYRARVSGTQSGSVLCGEDVSPSVKHRH